MSFFKFVGGVIVNLVLLKKVAGLRTRYKAEQLAHLLHRLQAAIPVGSGHSLFQQSARCAAALWNELADKLVPYVYGDLHERSLAEPRCKSQSD